jgi:pectate lyase
MRNPTPALLSSALLCALSMAASSGHAAKVPDLSRQVLPAGDGWASLPTAQLPNGTTGGSAAAPGRVHRVRNRDELVAALAFPDATPKIIQIEGALDANVDAQNQPLACADYHRPDPQTGTPYSLEAFLQVYDPATWGRVSPGGPLERARAASAAAQQARVRIRIPANTTIVGVGRDATVRGAWFDIRPASTSGNTPMNVIIRNLSFEDTYDCFPQWAPTDGSTGNWNSLYDTLSVRNATHVWIDHNSFADVATASDTLPVHFGRLYEVHDGLLDVTNESDLVTISWNRFSNHDKTMLVGSSDGATADRGKLRLTLHHNLFENLGQRVPRVRFGQVHLYNNHYKVDDAAASGYGYSWGVGIESQIFAENNHFRVSDAITPDMFIERFNGTRIYESGSLLNGVSANSAIDIVAAYNAANEVDLLESVEWTPPLHGPILPTSKVPTVVMREAGPFK